ncbi:MAG: flagellar M-ring protein FliF [Gammaproteobacteria bacterium]|nr:flagellar M-ring protein FliF [Gammaproteobacteria bacterium]
MEILKPESVTEPVKGFDRLTLVRQVGLLVGFAALIAVAVSIALWAQKPTYRMLYGNLADQEVLEISKALDQANIPYEINKNTGAIMVDASMVHEARLKLAGVGLPKSSGTGYELLDKDQGFGASQMAETARYQRALEGELARTISSINSIRSARVHLALPKQSAFVRDKKKATASVVVTLNQGRQMSQEQASSIVHLVASSVPNLDSESVTVVDQMGRLLSSPAVNNDIRYSASQFEYRKNIEEYYVKRIESILAPIVGADKVRAQVTAELDYSVTEQTQENYNPDLPAVRSEQSIEEESKGGAGGPAGVPGTLSNQPPAGGTVQPNAASQTATQESPQNSSRRLVRNYELDRTISHTRMPSGTVRRLSVAVVLDQNSGSGGKKMTEAEITRLTSFVKEAVGFDSQRGDSVNVISAEFQTVAEPEAPVAEPLFDSGMLLDIGKQVAGVGLIIFIVIFVIKPILKALAEKGKHKGMAGDDMGRMATLDNSGALLAAQRKSYDEQLATAKSLATQDPRRVAQVVKQWVEKDA